MSSAVVVIGALRVEITLDKGMWIQLGCIITYIESYYDIIFMEYFFLFLQKIILCEYSLDMSLQGTSYDVLLEK